MVSQTQKVAKKSRINRTAISCDRCKARKTKCNKPDAEGPCDYCRNTDEVCSIDITKRRQKPFYFVSEEEYRLLRELCSQSYPNEELTLPTLRRLVSDSKAEPRQERGTIDTNTEIVTQECRVIETPDRLPVDGSAIHDQISLPEITNLHQDIGCLLPDAHGEYRYMGPESGISFNGAVRAWIMSMGARTKSAEKDKILPLQKVTPPSTLSPLAFPGSPKHSQDLIPPHDLLTTCASRFFEQVHCLYWLYSSESFYTRLDATFSSHSSDQSGSWICSLQSIVALCSPGEPLPDGSQNETPESLEKAKTLVPRVCDEADLDSIRALILLSNGFTNSAYVHLGLAVRIAFSLGLHLDKYCTRDSVVARANARRLWWTLFLFDQDLSLQLGKPCMTVSTASGAWEPPLPLENVVGPGLHTPNGYLDQAIKLARIGNDIRQQLYDGPVRDGQVLTQNHFIDATISLKGWLRNLPPHFSLSASVSPMYRRSLSLLHLKYWSTSMLITKPFLLHDLLRGDDLVQTTKQSAIARFSNSCISAAESSFDIFEDMIRHNAVSSLVVTDFFFAFETLQVFLAACGLYHGDVYRERVRSCLKALLAISVSGYPKHLLPETVFQLQQCGLVGSVDEDTVSAQPPDNYSNMDRFPRRSRRDRSEQWPNPFINELNMTDVIIDDDLWENIMNLPDVFPLETSV